MHLFHKISNTRYIALLCALISGCASHAAPPNLYDFGPLHASAANTDSTGTIAGAPLQSISIASVDAPAALNSPLMLYRLNYVNDLQTRSYANSRWSMTPAQLLEQRIKARLAQAGTVVLSGRESTDTLPTLRIELDEMIQSFSSLNQSQAQLALRATLSKGRTLLAQKSFRQQIAAASADAAGGAQAMASASDALIGEIMAWLADQPISQQK
ncbi:MAG: ABC transporter [Glaciimonas sp.]|nr:ABC transporter [Glaciimonas sp.]